MVLFGDVERLVDRLCGGGCRLPLLLLSEPERVQRRLPEPDRLLDQPVERLVDELAQAAR